MQIFLKEWSVSSLIYKYSLYDVYEKAALLCDKTSDLVVDTGVMLTEQCYLTEINERECAG